MLEYMLCRPQDNVFLGKISGRWCLTRPIVYGVLATEITLLQRRLLLRCCLDSSDVLQFATSATLRKADDLKPFAAKLFSKTNINTGYRREQAGIAANFKGQMPSMEDICSGRWPQEKEVLSATPLVHSLVDRLWDKSIRLSELSANLFLLKALSRRATRVLLGLCALTRKNIDDFPITEPDSFLFRGRGSRYSSTRLSEKTVLRGTAGRWCRDILSVVPKREFAVSACDATMRQGVLSCRDEQKQGTLTAPHRRCRVMIMKTIR